MVQRLWSWTRQLSRRAEFEAPVGEDTGIRVLLISHDEKYRSEWMRIFDSRGWVLECAPTFREALNILRARAVPVLVYDSQAADDEWREVLTTLRGLAHCPCILLTSSVIDDSFGDEVVRLHGYDVFSRHASEDEIARTITAAWFWKQRHA